MTDNEISILYKKILKAISRKQGFVTNHKRGCRKIDVKLKMGDISQCDPNMSSITLSHCFCFIYQCAQPVKILLFQIYWIANKERGKGKGLASIQTLTANTDIRTSWLYKYCLNPKFPTRDKYQTLKAL